MRLDGTMESLNTQRVGELFVMQYYTQMHKDASQMHRFYLDESSFVRGGAEMGAEQPVIGQKAIHEKIVSMGLSEVHTKIRQVDSHMSVHVANGFTIVVQVTGELSVGGHPMRPFVQTFVLAPESPKKYYIHNDIFRYQIYDEEMSESELLEQPTGRELMDDVDEVKDVVTSPSLPEDAHCHQESSIQPPVPVEQVAMSPVPSVGRSDPVPPAAWQDQFQDPVEANGLVEEHHDPPHEEPVLPSVEEAELPPPVTETYPEQPKTWASRLSQGIPSGGGKVVVVSSTQSTPPSKPQTNASSQPQPQREPRPPRRVQQDRDQSQSTDRKPGGPFIPRSLPDAYQIFVGGLPPGATNEELKNVFSEFGSIMEVRVNPKNFAFVVFDSEAPVLKIMQQKTANPIQIRGKNLNIEEKKPTEKRGAYGGPPPGPRKGFSQSTGPGSNASRNKQGKMPRRT